VDPKSERDNNLATPTVGDFFWNTDLPMAKKRKSFWSDDETRFRLHCRDIATLKDTELTAHHVMKIQLGMSESKHDHGAYSAATCNRIIALLKTMDKLANSLLVIPNVAAKITKLPENNARTRYCDIDETRQLVASARPYKCPSVGNFIALLFLKGCRLSEDCFYLLEAKFHQR
jgi:hypothetical protein